jgi:hypothetical protein
MHGPTGTWKPRTAKSAKSMARRAEPGINKKGAATLDRAPCELPVKFTPRFLDDSDSRLHVIRVLRRRFELLKEHTGADSIQKELLCKRVAFMSVVCETMEVTVAEGKDGAFESLGAYVQSCNALSGLLKTLGLDKKLKNATSLKTYLEERQ